MDIHSVSKRFSISPPRPFLPSFFFTSSMLFELSLKRDIRLYPALSTDVRKWKNGCTWIFIQFETFSLSPSSYPFLSSIFFSRSRDISNFERTHVYRNGAKR